MVDCFVATLDVTPGRIEMCRETLGGLKNMPGLRVTLLDAGSELGQLEWFRDQGFNIVPHPREGSTHRRYVLPEILALSEYYFLLDDDCPPVTHAWPSRAVEIARAHPQFGLIGFHKAKGDYASVGNFQDKDVRSVDTVGGAMLVRRDARTAEFKIPLVADHKLGRMNDNDYSHAIRDSGWLVGQFEQLFCKHLDTTGSETTYRKDIVRGLLG